MYNAVMTHESQGAQHLGGKAANESSREANESVCFDQFVQIDAKEFHSNAEMVTEVKMLSHFDDVVLFIRVLYGVSVHQCQQQGNAYPFTQIVQYLDLHKCLMMEPFLVSDDLNGNRFTSTVISTVQNLTKGSLPERINHFVSIGQVIAIDDKIVAPIIIIAVIVCGIVTSSKFLVTPGPDVVHSRKLENFFAFIIGEVDSLTAFQHG
jgi:hypothetical protein